VNSNPCFRLDTPYIDGEGGELGVSEGRLGGAIVWNWEVQFDGLSFIQACEAANFAARVFEVKPLITPKRAEFLKKRLCEDGYARAGNNVTGTTSVDFSIAARMLCVTFCTTTPPLYDNYHITRALKPWITSSVSIL